jgi:ammonia channel protein AmtB
MKSIIVMAVCSLTFFIFGYGFATDANGGLMGQDHFAGNNYDYDDYARWLYYYSLCVTMAQIATGSIAERISLDTYFFFTFLTSGIIFPVAIAWSWEDGWLENLGFKDYAGAGIVHMTAGISGFVGTLICGSRIGLYHKDHKNQYMLDDENFSDDCSDDSNDELDRNIDFGRLSLSERKIKQMQTRKEENLEKSKHSSSNYSENFNTSVLLSKG